MAIITKSKKIKKNQEGFTLIDLMLSLAMIAIITGTVLKVARFSDTQKNLTLAKDQVKAAIRLAKSYSLSIPTSTPGEHVCAFGFSVDSLTGYKVYYSVPTANNWNSSPDTACNACLYPPSDADCTIHSIQTSSLPKGISFSSASGSSVAFKVPYGDVGFSPPGASNISFSGGGGVIINLVGKVE